MKTQLCFFVQHFYQLTCQFLSLEHIYCCTITEFYLRGAFTTAELLQNVIYVKAYKIILRLTRVTTLFARIALNEALNLLDQPYLLMEAYNRTFSREIDFLRMLDEWVMWWFTFIFLWIIVIPSILLTKFWYNIKAMEKVFDWVWYRIMLQ